MWHTAVLHVVVGAEAELVLVGVGAGHLAVLAATQTIEAAQGLANLHLERIVGRGVLGLGNLLGVVDFVGLVVVHSLGRSREAHAEGRASKQDFCVKGFHKFEIDG